MPLRTFLLIVLIGGLISCSYTPKNSKRMEYSILKVIIDTNSSFYLDGIKVSTKYNNYTIENMLYDEVLAQVVYVLDSIEKGEAKLQLTSFHDRTFSKDISIVGDTTIFIKAIELSNFQNTERNQGRKAILKFYNVPVDTILTEGKLINFWESFKKALLEKDYDRLKILSTDCIHSHRGFVPVNVFYEKYYTQIFNSNLLRRMNDTAKVAGHYDEANWHIYSKDCIFKSSGLKKPKIAEIFVRIVDRNSFNDDVGDAAIAFIETKSGYKFCGFSTVP